MVREDGIGGRQRTQGPWAPCPAEGLGKTELA